MTVELNTIKTDLTIIMDDNKLKLVNRNKTILTVSVENFLNSPDKLPE